MRDIDEPKEVLFERMKAMEVEKSKPFLLCTQCKKLSEYDLKDVFYDDNYSHCSARLVRCPECGSIQLICYEFDTSYLEETEYRERKMNVS